MLRKRVTAMTVLVWVALVFSAFVVITRRAGVPGEGALDAPSRFPEDIGLTHTAGAPTVIMVVHPRCACSRASLAQLDRLLARAAPGGRAYVVFSPAEAGGSGDLHALAAAIPRATTLDDPQGTIARRLGARTSGQLFVYAAGGALAYAGGVTPARGHEGDSEGFDTALRAARGEPPRSAVAAVFGCELFNR